MKPLEKIRFEKDLYFFYEAGVKSGNIYCYSIGDNMLNEIFLPIEGWPNYYVSNLGRVISTKYNKIRYLKQHINGKGYYHIKPSVNGKPVNITVHRLVAETFIPFVPGKELIDHIDNNPLNNCATNLRWVNPAENNYYNKAKENLL